MKAAILYGARDLRMEERDLDVDALGPNQLYVETLVSALSTGTDLGNYLGDSTYVPDAPDYPRQVGYSNVGVVRKVGSAVTQFSPGQRIFSRHYHQSAFVASESEVLTPIPDGVPSDEASLAYLTHLGLAGLRQARYETGENVAIVGLGVIGLCTVGLARAMGAKVVAISNSPKRSEAALKMGAHAAVEYRDPGVGDCIAQTFGDEGTDLVILTANPWPAYRLSVDIARTGGRISILGFPGRFQEPPDFNPLDPEWFYAKQLTLLGAGYAPGTDAPASDLRFNIRRNLQYIMSLLATRDMRFDSLITHRFPPERMKEAYELALEHSKELIAAVFDWPQND